VARAEDWPWSSLAWLRSPSLVPILNPGPVPRGEDWLTQVQEPATEAEWARLEESLRRGRPFGGDGWIEATAKKLGLEATLRPIGRPRKKSEDTTEHMSPLFGFGGIRNVPGMSLLIFSVEFSGCPSRFDHLRRQ